MKLSSSVMFQRTLILAAISAAFAQLIPLRLPFQPCETMTWRLQLPKYRKLDPYTFRNISNFSNIYDDNRFNFDFINLTFEGFSHVTCEHFNAYGTQMVLLNLKGPNVEFRTESSEAKIMRQGMEFPLIASPFSLKVYNYTVDMVFQYDYYTPYHFRLCIINGSLEMTIGAERIEVDIPANPELSQELNNHQSAVGDAINRYFPRLANDLTETLNDDLCSTPFYDRRP